MENTGTVLAFRGVRGSSGGVLKDPSLLAPRMRLLALLVAGLAGLPGFHAHDGAHAAAAAENFDVLIRGGEVVDGTGAARFRADVGLTGDRIAKVGDLSGATATTVVDATGKIVSPGFIDIMMGSSLLSGGFVALPGGAGPEEPPGGYGYLPQSSNDNSLQMGVTTGVLDTEGGYVDKAQERADIERSGTGTNLALCWAVGPAYAQVVGAARPPTQAEVDQLKALARKALDDGAFCLGSATQYCPTCYITTDGLAQVASVGKGYGVYFTSHIRNEEADVVNATRELIAVANAAGIPGRVNHMKVAGPVRCGLAKTTTGLLDEQIAQGKDFSADQYPYTAGETTDIGILIPDYAEQGTEADVQLRLRDPGQRPQIVKDTNAVIADFVGGPENVTFEPHGDTLADEMRLRGTDQPGEAVLQIRENEQTRFTILHYGCEQDVHTILGKAWLSIGTDDFPDPPIPGKTIQNPRAYGTYPRILAKYVRDERFLTLEEAVRKMTGQPAYRLGLADASTPRGLLKEGWAADVVVFDPNTVQDHATFTDAAAYSTGIDWVFVNGVAVKKDGAMIPVPLRLVAEPGKVLLHTKDMASRPQPGYDARPRAQAKQAPHESPLPALLPALAVAAAALWMQRRRRMA